jgi:two-component system, OmpR family, sensor kinase
VIARMSLRLRLLLAVAVMVLIALVVADLAVYASIKTYLFNHIDATLEASHLSVEATAENPASARHEILVGPPGAGERQRPAPGESAFCAVGRESAPGMFIAVRRPNGSDVTSVAGPEVCPSYAPGRVAYAPHLPVTVSGLVPETGQPRERVAYFTAPSTSPEGPAFRVRVSTLPNGDLLFVATPISSVTSTLSKLATVEWLVSLAALAASLLLGAWLVRVGLRPLRDVERTAEAITEGDLFQRVPNSNARTEVGHVATAFNVMVERIEVLVTELRESEGRLRQFVADASHELRTPIAAVSGYAQLFRSGAAMGREDLVRVAEGIERETDRMSRLVEDLLLLARLDEHEPLSREPVELVGLALEARDTAIVAGPSWAVDVVATGPIEVLGDASALRRVLDNLLANVRAHTPPGTHATITVSRDGASARLAVVDDGPGIEEAQTEAIFERFYRVDGSRSRSTGGTGLGLSIVAAIVAAHGGTVRAVSAPGAGARFELALPALATAPGIATLSRPEAI